MRKEERKVVAYVGKLLKEKKKKDRRRIKELGWERDGVRKEERKVDRYMRERGGIEVGIHP